MCSAETILRAPGARRTGFDAPAQVGPVAPSADPDDFAGGPTARGALPLHTDAEVAAEDPPPMWWPWIGVLVCVILLGAARYGHAIATPLVVLGWGALVALPRVVATWWSRYDERTFPDRHERSTACGLERRVLIEGLWGVLAISDDGAAVVEDLWPVARGRAGPPLRSRPGVPARRGAPGERPAPVGPGPGAGAGPRAAARGPRPRGARLLAGRRDAAGARAGPGRARRAGAPAADLPAVAARSERRAATRTRRR